MHPNLTRRKLLAASLSASAGVIAALDSPPVAHAANQTGRAAGVEGSRIVPDSYNTLKTVDGRVFRYTWKHDGRWVNIGFEPAPRFTSSGAARKFATLAHSHNRTLMVRMAMYDPYKFDFLVPLVETIVSRAQSIAKDPVALLLSFVQGFSYKDEEGYQSWPTEVLLHAHGDCSDSSVLFAALIDIYHKYHVRRVRSSEQVPLWLYLFGVGATPIWPSASAATQTACIPEPGGAQVGRALSAITTCAKQRERVGRSANAPRAPWRRPMSCRPCCP